MLQCDKYANIRRAVESFAFGTKYNKMTIILRTEYNRESIVPSLFEVFCSSLDLGHLF